MIWLYVGGGIVMIAAGVLVAYGLTLRKRGSVPEPVDTGDLAALDAPPSGTSPALGDGADDDGVDVEASVIGPLAPEAFETVEQTEAEAPSEHDPNADGGLIAQVQEALEERDEDAPADVATADDEAAEDAADAEDEAADGADAEGAEGAEGGEVTADAGTTEVPAEEDIAVVPAEEDTTEVPAEEVVEVAEVDLDEVPSKLVAPWDVPKSTRDLLAETQEAVDEVADAQTLALLDEAATAADEAAADENPQTEK